MFRTLTAALILGVLLGTAGPVAADGSQGRRDTVAPAPGSSGPAGSGDAGPLDNEAHDAERRTAAPPESLAC